MDLFVFNRPEIGPADLSKEELHRQAFLYRRSWRSDAGGGSWELGIGIWQACHVCAIAQVRNYRREAEVEPVNSRGTLMLIVSPFENSQNVEMGGISRVGNLFWNKTALRFSFAALSDFYAVLRRPQQAVL